MGSFDGESVGYPEVVIGAHSCSFPQHGFSCGWTESQPSGDSLRFSPWRVLTVWHGLFEGVPAGEETGDGYSGADVSSGTESAGQRFLRVRLR